MRGIKKLLCLTIPVALIMSFVLSLSILSFDNNIFADWVSASSGVYVGSGATYSVSGGTISRDIDVSGGTLTLTGGTISGNINLDGKMNLSSGCTVSGTVNLKNTSSYITLTSSLTKVIKVNPSSTANGTKIAYASSTSYLDTSKFSVTGLGSNQYLDVVGNYIQIATKQAVTYTVTIEADEGGTVDVETISNVPSGTEIIIENNTLTINGTKVTATADYGYEFKEWIGISQSVTSNMTIIAIFLKTGGTGGTFTYQDNGQVERGASEYSGSHIIDKLFYGGKINVICRQSDEDYGYLRALFEKALGNEPSIEEIMGYYSSFVGDASFSELEKYVADKSEATLVIEYYEEEDIDRALQDYADSGNIANYDLVLYNRDPTPLKSTENFNGDYSSSYYVKNKLIFGFPASDYGAFDIPQVDSLLVFLIDKGFAVFEPDYEPVTISSNATKLPAFAQSLLDFLKTIIENEEIPIYNDEVWSYLLERYDSIQVHADISIEEFFEDPENILFFYIISDAQYQYIYNYFENYGRTPQALYDSTYVYYKILSEVYGDEWYDAYWSNVNYSGQAKPMYRVFTHFCAYPGNLLLVDEDVYVEEDPDLQMLIELSTMLRSLGREYWSLRFNDSAIGSKISVPYVYVGVDGDGEFFLMVNEGLESYLYDEGMFMSLTINEYYYDNKQYYLYPIKERR